MLNNSLSLGRGLDLILIGRGWLAKLLPTRLEHIPKRLLFLQKSLRPPLDKNKKIDNVCQQHKLTYSSFSMSSCFCRMTSSYIYCTFLSLKAVSVSQSTV